MASPNVPNVPGVPALNQIGAVIAPIVLLVSDARSVLSLFTQVKWGIFDNNGRAVVAASNVKGVSVVADARISDYQVENGQFASYNKVQTPNGVKLTYTRGGTLAERTAFLAQIEAAKQSIELFQVITPEQTYQRMNVVHYDYDRTALHGVTLLTVDVWCEEVRSAPSLQFSTTGAPDGAPAQNGGDVQPVTPSTSDVTIVRENLPTITHEDLGPL